MNKTSFHWWLRNKFCTNLLIFKSMTINQWRKSHFMSKKKSLTYLANFFYESFFCLNLQITQLLTTTRPSIITFIYFSRFYSSYIFSKWKKNQLRWNLSLFTHSSLSCFPRTGFQWQTFAAFKILSHVRWMQISSSTNIRHKDAIDLLTC